MAPPPQDIEAFLDRQAVALLGSVDADGVPHIKAMLAPRRRAGLTTFHLTTNTSSRRVAHFRANPAASLYFFDGATFRGLLFTGTMAVLTDAASKRLIWREGDEMYYPAGVDDPDYCVLRFTARAGRAYAGFASVDFEVG